MKSRQFTCRLGVASLAISFVFVAGTAWATPTVKAGVADQAAAQTISAGASRFIENTGQWDAGALFLSRTSGLNLWITQEGAVFDFNKFVSTGATKSSGKFKERAGYTIGHVVKMSLVNARPTLVEGEGEQSGKFNYFIGNDRGKWATNVRGFAEAVSEQPYNGISVRYSIDQGVPRYDLIVKPYANLSQVGMEIEGADGAQVLPNGNLQLKTSLGNIEERGLTAYQETVSGRTQIPCRMVMDGNVVHFDIGSYDSSKTLIVDPLICSTFLGGSSPGDIPNAVAADAVDDVYVVGQAVSTNFPTTTGAYQTKNIDPSGIAFVTKLSEGESSLIYSTFIGGVGNGSAGDSAVSVAVDKTYNAYVTGVTYSPSFPTTAGAFQTTNKEKTNGGPNGFVTKFNPTGTALVYSTYLGGSGFNGAGDSPTGIAIDSLGDAYVVGGTYSSNFPTTTGAYQKTDLESANEGSAGFVTKLNPTGTAPYFSTYLAGSGDSGGANGENVTAVAVDASYNVYVAGTTYSSNFPTVTGSFQTTNNAFKNDVSTGFVLKLNAAGSAPYFSTYLGGSSADTISALVIDSGLNVTVVGSASSTDFPVTPTAFMVWDPETNSTASTPTSAFATRLAATGKTLIYSTYLGGSGGLDAALGVTLDSSANAIIVGETSSSDFPVTAGAFETVDQATNGAPTTGFVTKLASTGETLLYSTFLGGSGNGPNNGDQCSGIAVDPAGYVVVVGTTSSVDFPTTGTGYDQVYASGFESTFTLVTAAATISDIAIDPNPIPSGTVATGTITLTNSTTTDTSFKLSVTGPAVAPVSVTVPQGASTASFQFIAEGVNTATTLDITATAGTLTKTVATKVVPAILLSTANGGLVLNQTAVLGGASVGATITLNGYAGSPYTAVTLTSSDPAAASVESSVLVPGNTASTRTTIKTSAVSAGVTVTFTATLGSSTATATLLVRTARVALLTLPASTVGGTTIQGKILLSAPAGPLGDVINLSSNSVDATVPVTITVPAGMTSVTFNIVTKAVTTNVTTIITAAYAENSKTATLLVEK